MGGREESPLDAAERSARESRRLAEESKRRRDAEEAVAAQTAGQSASELIDQCLDRLAQAGWPGGLELTVQEQGSRTVGFIRKRQIPQTIFRNHEVWAAPAGVGFKTGRLIGTMLGGGWEYIYNSQIAIDRDGNLWHGNFPTEKGRSSHGKLAKPINGTQLEALTEALGAILAKYVRRRSS